MDFLFTKSKINAKQLKVIKSEPEFLMDTNMDTCPVEFMSDEWPSSPDDFFESILNLNSDDLLNDLHNNGGIDDNNINNNVDAINEIATSLMKSSERVLSPPATIAVSSPPEMDIHQYFTTTSNGIINNNVETTNINDDVDMKNISLCLNNNFNEIKCENVAISSGSSDSGLSSDHLDLDMSPDYEPLSPTLSSPGPSISERGGQNSPPRYIRIKQHQPSKQHHQHLINLQHNNNSVKLSKPKVIVEKIQSPDGGLMFNKELGHIQIQPQNVQLTKNSSKEVKIYRMAPTNNNNNNYIKTTNQGVHSNGNLNNNNKKVTIQLKNTNTMKHQSSPVSGSNNGAVVINKKNLNGVRKLIRVQTPSNPRSILLPVSIPDVRTIKIINASNLKSKSPNIKLAAANLLQQSKQGLVQKNVLVTKEQLIEEFSDHNTSDDCESYVFEEVMQQSNSMLSSASHVKKEMKQNNMQVHDEDDDDDIDYEADDDNDLNQQAEINQSGSYPKLLLTMEEKRLLVKEGIALPTNYPLTKHEERELKRIRRKIRNKISAQDSRKRKKEYVDGLEERVKQCTEENQTLLKRIKILQSQNHNLMSQMKKLQTLLTKGTNKTAQPATCLMVLLLSMALVAVPNLKLGQNAIKDSDLADVVEESLLNVNQQSVRRNLLFNSNDGSSALSSSALEEDMNIDDILSFNEHDYINEENNIPLSDGPSSIKRSKNLVDYDVDDTIWKPNHNTCFGSSNKVNTNTEYEKHAKEYQENLKKIQSSGFNIESTKNLHVNNVLNTLNDVVKMNNDFLYELQMDDELKKNIINKNDGTLIDLNLVKNENFINDKIKKINSTQQRNNNKNNDNSSRIKITV